MKWLVAANPLRTQFPLLGLWTTPLSEGLSGILIAQVVARVRQPSVSLTDGWKVYTAAFLQGCGVLYRPRRRRKVGRKPEPWLVAPKDLFYTQVVKVRNKTGRVVEVSTPVVYSGPCRFW